MKEETKHLAVATVYNPTVDLSTQVQSEHDSAIQAIEWADKLKNQDPANVICRVFTIHTKEIHSLP